MQEDQHLVLLCGSRAQHTNLTNKDTIHTFTGKLNSNIVSSPLGKSTPASHELNEQSYIHDAHIRGLIPLAEQKQWRGQRWYSLGASAAHGRAEPSIKLEHNELVQQLLRLLEICVAATCSKQCSHRVAKTFPIGSTHDHHTTLN